MKQTMGGWVSIVKRKTWGGHGGERLAFSVTQSVLLRIYHSVAKVAACASPQAKTLSIYCMSTTRRRGDLREVLYRLFDGLNVTHGQATDYVAMPLTDFVPPVDPGDLMTLCEAFHAHISSMPRLGDGGVDALVGIASRSGGPLVHGVATISGVPYSLANWYPEGSQGHIAVGHDAGFSGSGVTYLNGLKVGQRVIFLDDCLRSGKTACGLIRAARDNGIVVLGAVFAAELHERGGRECLEREFPGLPVASLCCFSSAAAKTHMVSVNEDIVNATLRIQRAAPPLTYAVPVPTDDDMGRWTDAALLRKFELVLAAFVGVPIYRADNSEYPYSNFTLTDFDPLLQPQLVEAMADCLLYLFGGPDLFRASIDIIVSEADRGGGPLALAMANRTGVRFTLANWFSDCTDVGSATNAYVGYAGQGKIFLNGIAKGARAYVIDDMLSSGGTCEALFKGIEAAGGVLVAAGFASEKVNTGGRGRLLKQWPDARLHSACYFISQGDRTEAHGPTENPVGNPTPLQLAGKR